MRRKKEEKSRAPVQFEKHQPERRRPIGAYLFCNGGCCCCCCCLHTLGGLIGAAAATSKRKTPKGASVAGFYWTCLAVGTGAAILLSLVLWPPGGFVIGLISVLLFLPVGQLVASVLTLIRIQVREADLSDKKSSLLMLGKLTLWSILGAVVGFVAMFVGYKMLYP
jgi:hypothetical protein